MNLSGSLKEGWACIERKMPTLNMQWFCNTFLVMYLLVYKQQMVPAFICNKLVHFQQESMRTLCKGEDGPIFWNFTVYVSSFQNDKPPQTGVGMYTGFLHIHSFRHTPFSLCVWCIVCHFMYRHETPAWSWWWFWHRYLYIHWYKEHHFFWGKLN